MYVAVPPLYKLEISGKAAAAAAASTSGTTSSGGSGRRSTVWCYSDGQLKEATKGLPLGSYTVQRFKGLGEMMPEQLWSTTLNPETRCVLALRF